jgi:CHAD domain-containing protein
MKNAVKGRGKLATSLQDAALDRITGTIAELEKCREPSLAEATHEIRRNGKKLRALLRLVRSCLGRRAYEADDAGLRAMGREFGKLRDAQVMVHALDALWKRYFERRRPALLTHARRLLLAKKGRRARRLTEGDTIAATTAALQAARARCLAWDLRGFGPKEALRALRQSYKRTRAAGSCASAEPSVKRLHAWRRRTKEQAEQVRLLCRLHPPSLKELAHELDVLGEFLGDDHDLTLLRDELVVHRATLTPPHELDALLEVLDLRRGELIRTAIDLGERLFEQTAKEFAHALEESHEQHRLAKKKAGKLASIGLG